VITAGSVSGLLAKLEQANQTQRHKNSIHKANKYINRLAKDDPLSNCHNIDLPILASAGWGQHQWYWHSSCVMTLSLWSYLAAVRLAQAQASWEGE